MKKLHLRAFALLFLLGILVSPWVACETRDRTTPFPASTHPDQVCLTWSGDPCTTQTVQWRTAPAVAEGTVQYRKKDEPESATKDATAKVTTLTDEAIANDPSVHRFTATLKGLDPATTYAYRVGNKQDNTCSDWFEFTTAPKGREPFSFIYLGDPQVGLETWGKLLHKAYERFPKAAFYIVAGDNVNHGHWRDEWDILFQAAAGVYDRRPTMPAIGNHDCAGPAGPRLYLDLFTLPENGPDTIPPERAYSFHYSNALIIVLDSNLAPQKQRAWLDKQLADASDATWKFVTYHHPAYSSGGNRDNPQVREQWCDVFDKYHVDMVFQGHDHAYLRTPPMKANHAVASPAEGTIYVIAVSGTKHYKQDQHDYTAVGFTDVSTYQVIDIDTNGADKLTYHAYDIDGTSRDEVVIEKAHH